MSFFSRSKKVFEKPFVFLTGTPRSGTSMLTKVIDAHPDVAVLMENLFGNRRRHWERASFWENPDLLKAEIVRAYSGLSEKVIGNKVCTPDVWSVDDIIYFCKLFPNFKVIFIVRDPIQVALSRFRREDYEKEYNSLARKHLQLDFSSRSLTYTSSWTKCLQNYRYLKGLIPEQILLIYYEDFCKTFEQHVDTIINFLGLNFSSEMLKWHELPHHNAEGTLARDIKYSDAPVCESKNCDMQLTDELISAISTIQPLYERWRQREL